MTQHARLGASKAERWMQCPGSTRLSDGIPETTSKYAEEGTVAHAYGASQLDPDNNPFDPSDVTVEMGAAVKVYVDYVRERSVGKELFVETRFNLTPLNPPEPMFGTADTVIWDEATKTLEVVDYKHGAGVYVEVQDNPQFLMYGLGAVVETRQKPEKIITTVVQPRYHGDEDKIRSAEYTWADLVAFKKKLFDAAVATQADDAPLTVGSWCRFCPAHAVCPAQEAHTALVAQSEFSVHASEPMELPVPTALDDEQLKFVLDNADIVRKWFDAVEEHATARLVSGEEFPGYKLVAGRANRQWKDEDHIAQYLTRKGLKVGERYTRKLISPAQAEKVFKAKDLGKLPERFVVQPTGAPKLAPESDKRPAIAAGAHIDFQPTLEQE